MSYYDEARAALERAAHSLRAFLGVLQLAFKDVIEPYATLPVNVSLNITLFVEAWLRAHGDLYWQAFYIACQEGIACDLLLIPDRETGRVFFVFRDLRDDSEVVWEQAEMDETLYSLIAGCTKPITVLDRISEERYGQSWVDLCVNPAEVEGMEDPFALES